MKLVPKTILLTATLQCTAPPASIQQNQEPGAALSSGHSGASFAQQSCLEQKAQWSMQHEEEHTAHVSQRPSAMQNSSMETSPGNAGLAVYEATSASHVELSSADVSGANKSIAGDADGLGSSTSTSEGLPARLEALVGTAEVSFDRITHGPHLFLNPPNVSLDRGVVEKSGALYARVYVCACLPAEHVYKSIVHML